MERSDLLMIIGSIFFGLGIANDKLILTALACACFFTAGRDRRRERASRREKEHVDD